MYNPYNWEITKEDKSKEVEMSFSIFPGAMTKKCILDELTEKNVERDMVNLEVTKIMNELKDLKNAVKAKEIYLEAKLTELYELDESILEICRSLPVFDK